MKHSKKDSKKIVSGLFLTPSLSSAYAISQIFSQTNLIDEETKGLDSSALLDHLREQNKLLFNDDISRIEAMLLDQAHVLQSMFTLYTTKMAKAEYTSQLECFAKIALKAQNQCRQSLATLGELKNPKRTTFIKQQNNATNQQINQLGPSQENSKKITEPANELLEEKPDERQDFGTTQETGGNDQKMETVETVNRSKDGNR